MLKMTFGQRLKMLRLEKSLTLDELAVDFVKNCNLIITKSSLSYYENDKRTPEVKILKALAEYFNVSIDFLMCRTDSRNELTPTHSFFDPDNVLMKDWQEAKQIIRERLIEKGVLKKDEELPLEYYKKIIQIALDIQSVSDSLSSNSTSK